VRNLKRELTVIGICFEAEIAQKNEVVGLSL